MLNTTQTMNFKRYHQAQAIPRSVSLIADAYFPIYNYRTLHTAAAAISRSQLGFGAIALISLDAR